MAIMLRRLLVLAAFTFWQGGFTFYGAVVVPVGSDILGSHQEQGRITRSVTNYLNIAGAVALAIWPWDIAAARDPLTWRRRVRWCLWLLLVLALALLVGVHVRLDELLDAAPDTVDRAHFHAVHAWYLHISTAQWASSLLLAALTLFAWRREDSQGA